MTENIKLEVVTPEKTVVNEMVKVVMVPGILGEFGVLFGHTPFLTSLKGAGSVHFKSADGYEEFIFVSSGFAEALSDKVIILVDSAERKKDINLERAKKALERASTRLEQSKNDQSIDLERAHFALIRATQRIRLVEEKSMTR